MFLGERNDEEDPLVAVIPSFRINKEPNQHPLDIEEDFSVVVNLIKEEL